MSVVAETAPVYDYTKYQDDCLSFKSYGTNGNSTSTTTKKSGSCFETLNDQN